MVNHFQEYATTKGFLILDYPKQYFTTTEYSNNFPGESNQSLGSNKLNLPHKQEEDIGIALPNLMAVPRVIIVVLMSRTIGSLATKISFVFL